MKVTKKDGVVILRVNCQVEAYEGELSFQAFREKCPDIELFSFIEAISGALLIDDEGKLRCDPKSNLRASCMYLYGFNKKGIAIDYIAGDAVYIPCNIMEAWIKEESEDEDDEDTII